ncbi:thr operon leader peptide [Pantoea sp. Ap-870]|uniref:thr operon leader peptide n=4 Tax=Pantoea TaxID=53335 RepID=A0A437T6C9_9GAMM|nr:thr operon leader peptide [Pantoea sp. B_9]KAA6114030.1 thr operon leader peptide [Pantoea sp. B_10]KAA8667686.1 thr operon leader peptide [Pantoea dispersa]MBK0123339.1 thr operon leader peptide [Pantoea sp. S61]MBK4769771.1 thr operon leader peptide [Pantoea sp. Morm]MXP53776.1 thr operon leader peptide [Pantoea sp. Seng]MXP61432.1 thr operon leader peptide [Pantoea sp. Taur]NIE52468.1 thr operon leader peptide [Pantoea sp. Ap-870]NIF01069.1 thr operon leader peptide [Pantoea formicae]
MRFALLLEGRRTRQRQTEKISMRNHSLNTTIIITTTITTGNGAG